MTISVRTCHSNPPVDEDILEMKLQDEVNEFLLQLLVALPAVCASLLAEQAESVY